MQRIPKKCLCFHFAVSRQPIEAPQPQQVLYAVFLFPCNSRPAPANFSCKKPTSSQKPQPHVIQSSHQFSPSHIIGTEAYTKA